MSPTFFVRRRAVAATASGLDAALTRLRSLEEQPPGHPGAQWLHSYVLREADGGFALACLFRADSAQALRRHAALADLPADEIAALQSTRVLRPHAPTRVYLVRRHGVARDAAQLERRLATARRIADEDMAQQLSWMRSHVLREDGGALGTACLFQAIDPGALREHATRAGLPIDEITPVFGRLVFRDEDSSHPAPDPALSA